MDKSTKAPAASGDPIDFSGAWSELWASIRGNITPEMSDLMTVAGGALIVYSIVTFIWQRHRGRPDRGNRGSNGSGLGWTILIGCILAAPEVLIPLLLTGVDAVANTVLDAFDVG